MADATIHQFVRGAVDVAALEPLGIAVAFEGGGMTLRDNSQPDLVVRPSVADVASGYVASWARGTDALQRWAQVMLGLTPVDLSALEDSPDGDALLEAIWDASAGAPSGIDLASRLADG